MKYRYIKDCYTEGWSLGENEHDTVDAAVKDAQANCYGNPFHIVAMIEWEAKEAKS